MKLLRGLLAAGLILFCVGSAEAVTLDYSYTYTDLGNSILYSLKLDSTATGYDATFKINVTGNVSEGWWADGFDFKFINGQNDEDVTIGLAGWEAWDVSNDEKLWKGNGQYTFSRQGAGFYLSAMDDDDTTDEYANYQNGPMVSVDGTAATFNFSFTGSVRTDGIIPFQVVYYDGVQSNNNVVSAQLSRNLGGGGGGGGSQDVPEPSTLLLLGSGLLGLGLIRRRKAHR